MNEIEELKKDLDLIVAKATEYDKLDHKFKQVCGKSVEQTLQHLCLFGFGDGITEQQALNKLAERFPMTTDQIVSTLEMSQAGVNHESVEWPKLPKHIIDYLKWCGRNDKTLEEVITKAKFYNPDYAFWTEEETRDIAVAYCTGDYTVAKEPLYIISKPLEANEILKNYFVGFVGGMATLMDSRKKEAYKFSDFEQAKAVAYLICGNVEEEE